MTPEEKLQLIMDNLKCSLTATEFVAMTKLMIEECDEIFKKSEDSK